MSQLVGDKWLIRPGPDLSKAMVGETRDEEGELVRLKGYMTQRQ